MIELCMYVNDIALLTGASNQKWQYIWPANQKLDNNASLVVNNMATSIMQT